LVDFPINTGIRKIGDSRITGITGLDPSELWFGTIITPENIIIKLSNSNTIATIVVDFAFSVSTIVEYTLNGGTDFVAFNNGDPVVGGQSRFIDVTDEAIVNFRALTGGDLIRVVVSSVP